MSSRAFRRLQKDAEVVRIRGEVGKNVEEEEEEEGDVTPGFVSHPARGRKKNAPASNLFALLGEEEGDSLPSEEEKEEESAIGQDNGSSAATNNQSTAKKAKRKRKKKKAKSKDEVESKPVEDIDEVDAAIREVNEVLGETRLRDTAETEGAMATQVHKALLGVDRRFLNADNEMRKIFGSRVVRAEQARRRAHQRTYHRPTVLAAPRDTWPKMDKPGLTMQLDECKDGCQYFVFEHSPAYQSIQFRFWDAVETFDPNTIGAVLHAHPYHIDSLLQLSEVCKMSEDVQMAAELIERALYCFECCFHTLFTYTQGNCRLSYSRAENRPFFLALFRHLYYVGRRGCHRTALEFCKFLLSLDPEGDPVCVLLLIDYHALRAGEYQFLLNLYREWEPHRNLSQLPNFAFSVSLALFHSCSVGGGGGEGGDQEEGSTSDADEKLQEALIMFPSVLAPLMDKCGVTMDTTVVTHSFFRSEPYRDPEALKLLTRLYIERSHSLWKEPEVLTWLEANSRRVIARVDSGDPFVADCAQKKLKRYVGTPRNIYRHIVISDFEQVVASLPREIMNSAIVMYDPLPPPDSTSGYERPERQFAGLREDENPFLLFLRSLLPNFNPRAGPEAVAVGDPQHRRQMVAGLQQLQQERGRGGGGEMAGAEGLEGAAARPLNLQPMLDQLTNALQGLIDELRGVVGGEEEEEEEEEEEGDDQR